MDESLRADALTPPLSHRERKKATPRSVGPLAPLGGELG
ncbi:hypothetical protein DFQ50_10796 [Pseudocitrobacter faecalis]|uniref:Uncharacterized protein n=1 Tax=Pseudocitrobacter faecalis TaxID=1398493 RepID=A0ABX9FSM4_9ENTR|nr:hypothetical protein DFQ50_10796 [Pseudocitrobacter faecalis]